MKTKHKQVKVRCPYGGDVLFTCDENLEPFLSWCVLREYDTNNSCMANKPAGQDQTFVWVEFDLDSWQSFLSEAFSKNADLYWWLMDNAKTELLSFDDGYPINDTWVVGSELLWSVSMRFEASLLDEFNQLVGVEK